MAISTIDTSSISGLGYGFKNRIINGAMMIDQRNSGASVTPSNNNYTLDRWVYNSSQASKVTVQQTTGDGFGNSLKVTSSSSYSVLTADYFLLQQPIEGFNFADMQWGTANASAVTISFKVKSSLTGTFGGVLTNTDFTRSYPFSYTISAANTWEQKSVTIAGDTSGTWVGATNGIGCRMYFNLGTGATYSGTAGSWAGSAYLAPTGAVSVVGTSGATWQVTAVQLEKGTVATSFDYRPYGTELALCQRYYYKMNAAGTNGNYTSFGWGNAYGTTYLNLMVNFQVAMRSYPTTLDTSAMSTFQYETGTTAGTTPTSIAINANGNSPWNCVVDVVKSAAFTNAAMYKVQAANNQTAYLGFGAEL